ncbi:MAG: Ig-like domain-containing protein, partial [Betaproteobacteria bacterium]
MFAIVRRAVALALLLAFANVWAAPNKAPTVSITAPANGAVFSAPANITINANASDQNGTVTKVDFYAGAMLLATRTTAPYSVTWSNVTAGTYTLTAQATDNLGATKTSTAVSITVTGPKVVIASPPSGATVYGGSVTLDGTFAGDANTTVLVDNGNTSRLATINGNAFSATLPIYPGANTLRVVVARRDKSSDQVSVVVTGNGNPLLVFVTPTTTVFDAPADIVLGIDAVSPAGTIGKVDFYGNGTLLGGATTPPYRYAWSNVLAGNYSISAIATDNNGVTGTLSLPITVNGPNVLPAVTLTSPAPGAVFTAPANVPLAASASDSDGISLVEFLKDGTVVGSTNVAPYAMTLGSVAMGTYAIAARATDNRLGITLSSPVNVTVLPPNIPPTVSLTSPAPGATFGAPAAISIAASAGDTDGTVAKVEFYQGASLIGTVTTPPYTLTWSNVAVGSYSLTAKATDNLGATVTSAAVSVTVNANARPAVSLTAPVSGSTYFAPATINLAATASDSDGSVARVDFYQGSTLLGTLTSAPYAYVWDNVAGGSYSITAVATDNLGATTTSAARVVTVNGNVAVSVAPGIDGASIADDSFLFTGTMMAPPNSGITVNGQLAQIDANGNFYVNGLSLNPGSNAIVVTVNAQDGQTATQTVNVTSTGAAAFTVAASPTDGLAPLPVTFTMTNRGNVPFQSVEFDFDNSGSVDFSAPAASFTNGVFVLGATYPAGKWTTIVRIRDSNNTIIYSATKVITALPPLQLESRMRAVYTNMLDRLRAGNISGALTA